MIEYITTLNVDTYAISNDDWQQLDETTKQKAVDQANLYLNNQYLVDMEPVAHQVITAGCELALLANDERLYTADTEALASKQVRVGNLQINKTYVDSSLTNTGEMNFINALLKNYKKPSSPVFSVTRGM